MTETKAKSRRASGSEKWLKNAKRQLRVDPASLTDNEQNYAIDVALRLRKTLNELFVRLMACGLADAKRRRELIAECQCIANAAEKREFYDE